MNKIGIIGLGWLGKPLAVDLQNTGFEVKGTTTTFSKKKELIREGFVTYQLKVEPDALQGEVEAFFEDVDTLLVAIPPKVPMDDAFTFISTMKTLISHFSSYSIQRLIYISTTSVFEDREDLPMYTEFSIPNATSLKAKQLIEVEHLILNIPKIPSVVIRFGGLVGEKRHPVHHLTGKNQLPNSASPVNLIHLQDCIMLIRAVIEKRVYNQVLHGVSSIGYTKADFYRKAAQKRGLKPPEFLSYGGIGKKISASYTEELLQIKLNHLCL